MAQAVLIAEPKADAVVVDGGLKAVVAMSDHKRNRIQVSNNKKPLFFYLNLAKRYIKQHNDVELSALGMDWTVYGIHVDWVDYKRQTSYHAKSIPTLVTIAEILKANGLAVEKKVLTSTVGSKDENRGRLVQKAKLEIVLEKSENPRNHQSKTEPESNAAGAEANDNSDAAQPCADSAGTEPSLPGTEPPVPAGAGSNSDAHENSALSTPAFCTHPLNPLRNPSSLDLMETMAEVETEVAVEGGVPKKRTFKKFSFRGVDLDVLLDMSTEELVKLYPARARRRFQRGLKRKPMALIKKLCKAKREAPAGEKPEPIRTHLRNMIIMPEMIASVVGVYNGKTFNQVEIKPEMIGHYLAEFSISYKPVKHGRPGIGATHSSRFIPLK
ncbi:Small ribosomal subunit protein uS19-like protein [Drosera capensis]